MTWKRMLAGAVLAVSVLVGAALAGATQRGEATAEGRR